DAWLRQIFLSAHAGSSPPFFHPFPTPPRVFAILPKRGDVVVFRWPGDRSQVWVKRVIGLPGDRIAVHRGQVWIDGAPEGVRPAHEGQVEVGDGRAVSARRYIEALPGPDGDSLFKMLPCAPTHD